MRTVDEARRRENERRGEKERGEGEHRNSARQNVSLLYERNGRRNPPTKRPASDDVVLTTLSFARTYSPLRAASLDILAHRMRISSEDESDFTLRSTPEDLRAAGAGFQTRKELTRSLNGQLLLAPFVPRSSGAFYALLFLIRHIVIAIKINSCSRVAG